MVWNDPKTSVSAVREMLELPLGASFPLFRDSVDETLLELSALGRLTGEEQPLPRVAYDKFRPRVSARRTP